MITHHTSDGHVFQTLLWPHILSHSLNSTTHSLLFSLFQWAVLLLATSSSAKKPFQRLNRTIATYYYSSSNVAHHSSLLHYLHSYLHPPVAFLGFVFDNKVEEEVDAAYEAATARRDTGGLSTPPAGEELEVVLAVWGWWC